MSVLENMDQQNQNTRTTMLPCKWFFVAVIALLFSTLSPLVCVASGSQRGYFYGTQSNTIEGVIQTIVFPGPPEYMNVKKGDLPEQALVLVLEKPISVFPQKDAKDHLEEPEKNVFKVQLVVNWDDNIKVVMSKKVRVTGMFFHSHTGHHHTKVLMDVETVEASK